MLTVRVESTIGSDILEAVVEMKAFAAKLDVCALQKINGILVPVYPDSYPPQVVHRYRRAVESADTRWSHDYRLDQQPGNYS